MFILNSYFTWIGGLCRSKILKGAVQEKLTFLADMSAKEEGGGGNPLSAKKMSFFLGKKTKSAWNVLKCKNMQRYLSVIFVRGSSKSCIFSSFPVILKFLLSTYPSQSDFSSFIIICFRPFWCQKHIFVHMKHVR